VGSEWALEMAKYNLAHNYLVVGTTDEIEAFVAVLEAGLPRFFSGALEYFLTGFCSAYLCTFVVVVVAAAAAAAAAVAGCPLVPPGHGKSWKMMIM